MDQQQLPLFAQGVDFLKHVCNLRYQRKRQFGISTAINSCLKIGAC